MSSRAVLSQSIPLQTAVKLEQKSSHGKQYTMHAMKIKFTSTYVPEIFTRKIGQLGQILVSVLLFDLFWTLLD